MNLKLAWCGSGRVRTVPASGAAAFSAGSEISLCTNEVSCFGIAVVAFPLFHRFEVEGV
jgi:hypothetical protein